jgi:pyruvyl transferase EpsI
MIKKTLRTIFRYIPPLNRFYEKLSKRKALLNELKPFMRKYEANKNLVFLVFTPEHGNLGDHAIALAEILLLEKIGVEFVEIPYYLLHRLDSVGLLGFFNNKKILLHGGGYLGTLWFHEEEVVRRIIKNAPKSQIYALPNTIYYEDSDFGKAEFEKSKKIYNNHKDITFCARENTSYEIMKNAYKNVQLIPDMVFSLNKSAPSVNRRGCLLCLRDDLERTLSPHDRIAIEVYAKEMFPGKVDFTDMCLDCNISLEMRKTRLEEKFNQFKSAELVITDRLHGMIFCAITGTPCIVVNSKSHKVKGCYEWIKNLEYIKFTDDISLIPSIYKAMPQNEFIYDNDHLKPYYDTLESDIKNMLN